MKRKKNIRPGYVANALTAPNLYPLFLQCGNCSSSKGTNVRWKTYWLGSSFWRVLCFSVLQLQDGIIYRVIVWLTLSTARKVNIRFRLVRSPFRHWRNVHRHLLSSQSQQKRCPPSTITKKHACLHGYLEEVVGQTAQPGLCAVIVFCTYDADIDVALPRRFLRPAEYLAEGDICHAEGEVLLNLDLQNVGVLLRTLQRVSYRYTPE